MPNRTSNKPQIVNVLHVTYDMRIGGTEMVIKNIIEGFSPSSSFNMSIFCIEEPLGPWGEALKQNGCCIFSQSREPGFDTSLIASIRRTIKKHNIHIVHCHQYTPWVYGALATLGLNCRVIFTEHGRFYPDVTSWKRRFINPLLLKVTHAVTAISKATAMALEEFEYIPLRNTQIIYNGIKPLNQNVDACRKSIIDKYNIDPTATILGTVARFDPIKNHQMMVKTTAQLVKLGQSVHLILVGDGETREELKTLVASLGIEKAVTFTGYQPYPAKLIAAFDIFLLTSFSEGTSMTLLESMSLSKAAIVTAVGGNPEIVVDGETGFCVPSNDVERLTDRCLHLINNKALNVTFGHNAKLRFNDRLSVRVMVENFAAVYQHTLC